MAAQSTDLIGMADIARLAGQRRATVGNWKARNPDFPTERGRNARGPLYDRAEVIDWLQRTNRLDEPLPQLDSLMLDHLVSQYRNTEDAQYIPTIVLITLAVMKVAPKERPRLSDLGADENPVAVLAELVREHLPFAEQLIPWLDVDEDVLYHSLNIAATADEQSAAKMADVVVEQYMPALDVRSGEFRTPKSVRRLIIALARPDGVVYNPASGMGQLLLDAAAAMSSDGSSVAPAATMLIGQESNRRVAALSELNLIIHGVEQHILHSDVFFDTGIPELQADQVICVPPWNQKIPNIETLADDPRWVWGEPGPSDGSAAWIQHCLYYLADGGRAVIVLPAGALFESGRSGRIRQRIVKSGLLDAVISLPAGLFAPAASVRSAVMVFSRSTRAHQGTLMIDLTGAGDKTTRSGVVLDPGVIEQTARTYHNWIGGDAIDSTAAAVAAYDDLVGNEFVLDPGRYQPVLEELPDFDEMADVAAELRALLPDLIERSRAFDERVDLTNDGAAKCATSVLNSIRLSELTDVITITRGVPTKDTVSDGHMPVMSVADLRSGASPRHFVDHPALDDTGVTVPSPGDVLIAIEGGTVGDSFVVGGDSEPFIPSQQVAVLHVKHSDTTQLDPWYLAAWLTTEQAREQIRRLSRGAGIHRVPVKALWSLLVPIPTLSVQQEIGARFRTFNDAITAHRAVADGLKELIALDLTVAFGAPADPRDAAGVNWSR